MQPTRRDGNKTGDGDGVPVPPTKPVESPANDDVPTPGVPTSPLKGDVLNITVEYTNSIFARNIPLEYFRFPWYICTEYLCSEYVANISIYLNVSIDTYDEHFFCIFV